MNKPIVRSVATKALIRWQQPLPRQGLRKVAACASANSLSRNDAPYQPLQERHHPFISRGPLTLPQRMAYHSSPTVEFPVRRRRRPVQRGGGEGTSGDEDGDGGSTNNSPLKHNAVDDDVEFVQAASALLDKLEKAMEPMKRQNEIFQVERFFGDLGEVLTIDLGPKEGKYRVEMSLDDHLFEYTSPISGKILYVFSADTSEWVGIEDGHSFEGLLVRDLIRQCQGLPNL